VTESTPAVTVLNPPALQANFALVAGHGDDVAQYFYGALFMRHPETRSLFPTSMNAQRDRLLTALLRIVADVDRISELAPYLADLGRDHRKFGAIAEHYPAVGEALITTLAHFTGQAWTEDLEQNWTAAYEVIAGVMTGAAASAERTEPAWYEGEIVEVDRRTFDIAALRVRTTQRVPYLAGQSLAVEASTLRPRQWRPFTPGSAPGGYEFDLHVRAVDGGTVSTALVRAAQPGDRIRLGTPYGRMILDRESTRPVLMIAGGTGLAPMKAMVGQLVVDGGRPANLYFGARTMRENYDDRELGILAAANEWLTVVTAISADSRWPGASGLVGDVAVAAGDWSEHDVYVCGSPGMVEHTVKSLVAAGVRENQISFEEFGKG
jgi:NAD(P)H-flavin reductase